MTPKHKDYIRTLLKNRAKYLVRYGDELEMLLLEKPDNSCVLENIKFNNREKVLVNEIIKAL